MKRSMKSLAVILAVIALLSASSITSANVWLNSTDYGVNFRGAMAAAHTSGDVIEFRDNNTYVMWSTDNPQTDFDFHTPNVTVRSAVGYKATIEDRTNGMTGAFHIDAPNVTFENLVFKNIPYLPGNVPLPYGKYGTYVFSFYLNSGGNYLGQGLTVRNVDFYNVRGVIEAGSPYVKDLTFVDNLVDNTDYGLGKSGMNYGIGSTVITGNTFINNGTMDDKTAPREAAINIESNLGTLLIDDNTFTYNFNAEGQYAIYSGADLSAHPITLGTNDFGTGIGGSGAPYELYDLLGGGHAVGLQNAGSVVPEPATMALLAAGGIATLLRRRRSSKK